MPEPAESLLLSASLGALIGLIRQWESQHGTDRDPEFAGLRTFSLFAMLGCLAAYADLHHTRGALLAALGALALLLATMQFARRDNASTGYTTPGAALITFLVGALVAWEERPGAVLAAAMTLLLLGLKQPIHQWTRAFTAHDVRSVLQFVAITGVILPLVPNRSFGPYDAFNPWSTWLMVVLISGLGFLGYLLIRVLGSRAGITLSGLIGGLASSTATTLAFSRKSREDPANASQYALAVLLACNVMLVRVLCIALAISPALGHTLWLPVVVMLLPGLLYAARVGLARPTAPGTMESSGLSNPLNLSIAVKFALLYAGVTFLVKAATQLDLTQGVVAISAIAGLTDVDAITISMSDGAREGSLTPALATVAIVVGCVSNTLVKAGLAASLGSPALRRRVLTVLGTTAAAGLACLPFLR